MTTIADILAHIRTDSPHALETLAREWACRDLRLWQQSEELYLESGKKAIALGQPIMAFDMLKEGRSFFPQSAPLAYYAALALARSGSLGPASHIVQQLIDTLERHDRLYPDVLSLAGRLAKDRWLKSPQGARQQEFGSMAAEYYQQAYDCSGGDYFPGINAATMSVVCGRVEEGQRIARTVRDTCLAIHAQSSGSAYWIPATIGEACLLLGQQEEAAQYYRQAVALAGNNIGDIATIRRQVQLLGSYIDVDEAVLELLQVGRGVVFSGHMIDAPERPQPRFPPALEASVRAAIMAALQRLDVHFGYASAACGGDILFLECLLERGAEVHVMVPFRQEDFIRFSVGFAGAHWVERFHRVLARATTLRYATNEGYLGDDILFDYTAALLNGTAMLHADHLGADLMGLFLVDTTMPGRVGGTQDAMSTWKATGKKAEIIALEQLRTQAQAAGIALTPTPPVVATREAGEPMPTLPQGRQLKTMLFADMVGFSHLTEENAPSFVVHFLGEVAKVIDSVAAKPTFKNTWGDGLFLVFDTVVVGADFALRLRDMMQHTDWQAVGLPADTNIRIALHAGPVFPGNDLIIAQQNFFGSHVNMAARIEPITPPGAVYVSEQFASLLVASGSTDFACDYMGHLALAKGFGVYPIYRLRRAYEFE